MSVERGSVDPKKEKEVIEVVHDILGKKTDAEFRVDKNMAVRLHILDRAVDIEVRSMIPQIREDGYHLFPYTGVKVISPEVLYSKTRSISGVKRRNWHGVLGDGGRRGRKYLAQNPLSEYEFEPNLDYYIQLAADLDPGSRHDKFGRTSEEAAQEKQVVKDFKEVTSELFKFDVSGWAAAGIVMAPAVIFAHLSGQHSLGSEYSLGNGETALIKETGVFGRKVVDVFKNGSPTQQIFVRIPDRRLGMHMFNETGKRLRGNPVEVTEGKVIVNRLRNAQSTDS